MSGLNRPALPGRIQLQNAAAVLAILESLNMDRLLTPEIVNKAMSGLRLDGRFQIVNKDCRWIFDVAHNPGAAKVLAEMLGDYIKDGKIIGVVGMMADKDVAGVIQPLCESVDQWIAVSVAGSRAESAQRLAAKIANVSSKPCLIADSPSDGLQLAEARSSAEDTVLVAGSFYLVGPALEWLRGR